MKKQAFLVIAVAFGISGISSAVRPGQVVISDERVNEEVTRMVEEKEQSRNEQRDSNIATRVSEIPDAILVSPTNTEVRKQQITDEEYQAAHDDLENFKSEDLASQARVRLQDSDAARYNSKQLNSMLAAMIGVPAGSYLAYTGVRDLRLQGEDIAKAVQKDLQVRYLTRDLEKARNALYENSGKAGTDAAKAERTFRDFKKDPTQFIDNKYNEAVASADEKFKNATKGNRTAAWGNLQTAKMNRQKAILMKRAELYGKVLNLRSKLGLGVLDIGVARTAKKDITAAQKARIAQLEASLKKATDRASRQFRGKGYTKAIGGGLIAVGGVVMAVKWNSDLEDFQIDRSLSRQNHKSVAPAQSNISVESLNDL